MWTTQKYFWAVLPNALFALQSMAVCLLLAKIVNRFFRTYWEIIRDLFEMNEDG